MLTSLFKLSVTLGSPLCLIVLSISLSVNLIKANVCVCVCLPRAAVPLLNLNSSGLSYHVKESAAHVLDNDSLVTALNAALYEHPLKGNLNDVRDFQTCTFPLNRYEDRLQNCKDSNSFLCYHLSAFQSLYICAFEDVRSITLQPL